MIHPKDIHLCAKVEAALAGRTLAQLLALFVVTCRIGSLQETILSLFRTRVRQTEDNKTHFIVTTIIFVFLFLPGIGFGTPAAVAPTLQLFGRAVILQQVAQLVFVAAFPDPGDVLTHARLARD